ncbi:MAG: cytochrome-c oxidase, cbb3-type subunit II [Sphingomonadaceae bacterium]
MFRHEVVEKSTPLLLLLTLVTILIGGVVTVVPLFTIESTIEPVPGVRPYSPLELAGRNIYTREGCYTCHSQQIRPFRDEVDRYGHYSLAAESQFDHPFQWGSKRTGPDLARVGGKYSHAWHEAHLIDPRQVLPGSIMPAYGFLARREVNPDEMAAHLKTLKRLGVPYDEAMIANAAADMRAQADPDDPGLAEMQARYPKAPVGPFTNGGAPRDPDTPVRITEMDALIAYLQVLGTLAELDAIRPEQLRQTQRTAELRR